MIGTMVKDRSNEFPDKPEIKRYNFGYGTTSQNNNNTSELSSHHHPVTTPGNGTTSQQSSHTSHLITQQQVNYGSQPYNYSQIQTSTQDYVSRERFIDMHLV